MTDHEDSPPNEPPPTSPPGTFEIPVEMDTLRPPPIDFSKMSDSEKLHWVCNTVVRISNHVSEMHHKVNVMQSTLGIPELPDGPTLWELAEQTGQAVSELSKDLENFRSSVLGKGAIVHELRRAASIRSSAPPDDPNL